MFRLRYYVLFVAVVIFFIPYPTLPHFIWPLDWCVLADFCNHTWIPECGVANTSTGEAHYRLFIDECDMFEYNCDRDKDYELTNYSLCYGAACLDNDKSDKKLLRIGDYKVVGKERKLVYDPTNAYGQLIYTSPTKKFMFPSTTKPNLPKHMMAGRRRFTPHGPLWGRRFVAPDPTKAQKKKSRKTTKKRKRKKKRTTKKKTTTRKAEILRTVVIKKVTFKKKNKTFVRVFKGIVKKATTVTKDDEFLE